MITDFKLQWKKLYFSIDVTVLGIVRSQFFPSGHVISFVRSLDMSNPSTEEYVGLSVSTHMFSIMLHSTKA